MTPPAVSVFTDVPVSDSVNPLGDLDLFTFTLGSMQRVVLQATQTGAGGVINPCLRVLTSAGAPAVPGGLTCGGPFARLELVLRPGTYFVEVSDNGNNNTGGYVLVYEPITGAAAPLTPDVPVTDTISPPGDLDLFTFTLGTNERVVLQATQTGAGGVIDPCLRVLTPAGAPVVPGGSICGFPSARLDLLLQPGTYVVEVSDNGNNNTGGYMVLYEPIVSGAATPLAADVPVADSVGPVGDLDLFTFTLGTTERVVLQATQTGDGGSIDPCLRVLTPLGGPVVTDGSICGFPTARLDLVLDPGTYFVEASDSGNNNTGGYRLLFEPIVSGAAAPLAADVPMSETVNPVGDLDLFTFTLGTNQRVVLQAAATGAGGAIDPCLRVLTTAGTPVVPGGSTCGVPAARLDLVLAPGTYFVEVSDSGDNNTGGYTLLYEPIESGPAVASLLEDVPIAASVSPLGDLDLFTFTLASPTQVLLQASKTGVGGAIDPCLRVLTAPGGPVVAGGTVCGFPSANLSLALAPGTYFVEVSDSGNDQTGGYTLVRRRP